MLTSSDGLEWRWASHVIRMGVEESPRKLLEGIPVGQRGVGRLTLCGLRCQATETCSLEDGSTGLKKVAENFREDQYPVITCSVQRV